jgi:hypothetical protein
MTVEEWLTVQLERIIDFAQNSNHTLVAGALLILWLVLSGLGFVLFAIPILFQRWKKKRVEQPAPAPGP